MEKAAIVGEGQAPVSSLRRPDGFSTKGVPGMLALPLVLLGLASEASAQTPSCPNTKHTYVQETEQSSATGTYCGISIDFFGLHVGIGTWCPEHKITTPGHNECLGAPNPGTMCVPTGTVTPMKKKCDCAGLSLPVLGSIAPFGCKCGAPVALQPIQDAMTVPCPGYPNPPGGGGTVARPS